MSATEIRTELGELVSGRVGIADGVLPPALFVATNASLGLKAAALAGVGTAVSISLWRAARGRPVRFALSGLVGTTIAALLALRSGSSGDFFLPGILSGAVITVLVIVSLAVRRPFVAWASSLTRGWPLQWFWHPKVRPAYMRASVIWGAFFAVRTFAQWQLYRAGEVEELAVARILAGWPALLGLLVLTYVLGRRWLVRLSGPSVDEFEKGTSAPWTGQPKGF